jgi:hypothetical protein
VFVSTTGSNVSNLVCSFNQPCRTPTYAIDVADTLNLGQVFVSTGTYTGGTIADADVDVYGGYSSTWVRAANTTAGTR